MGGCAGKLNVSEVSRLASLPRQISFSRAKSQPKNSDPQVNGKEEAEKVETKAGGIEEKNGGEEKKEAALVDLSAEGVKSSSDDVPVAESATESKVETPVENNVNPSTENKVETPVVENAKPDDNVETLVDNSSEEKAEAQVSKSEDKAEAAVVVTEEPEVKQPEASPVDEPAKEPEAAPVDEPAKEPEAAPVDEPTKEPQAKIEAVVKEPEAKQPETSAAKVEEKTDAAASVAQ